MIKKIIKSLKLNNEVSDYKIVEDTTVSNQAFFVLGKLETRRISSTTECAVTVYHRENNLIGSSTFTISHNLSTKELNDKINETLYSAKLALNKDFNLVEGFKKKTIKDKPFADDFDTMINKINGFFEGAKETNVKFNAVEIFYNEKTIHVVNSRNVNLSSTVYSLDIEYIPSYDGEKDKVELYNYKTYVTLDYDLIKSEIENSVKDVKARYNARKVENIGKIDCILKDKDAEQFFGNIIYDFGYQQVFGGGTKEKIGDNLQTEKAKTKLNIKLSPSSKAKAFDKDGLILKPVDIVKDGVLLNYYGDNVYGQYLGVTPVGEPDELNVKKGSKSIESLTNSKRYLEIITLSGIQIDVRNDYIGGEIRLGILHDKDVTTPVSGISFSGSFKDAVNTFTSSKETVKIKGYSGPKYVKIKNLSVL